MPYQDKQRTALLVHLNRQSDLSELGKPRRLECGEEGAACEARTAQMCWSRFKLA